MFTQEFFQQEAADWVNDVKSTSLESLPKFIALIDEFIRIKTFADISYDVKNWVKEYDVTKLAYITELRNRLTDIHNEEMKRRQSPNILSKLFSSK